MLAWSHFYKTTSANEPFLWMLSSFHEWINLLIFHSSVDILSSIIETHFNHWKLSNNYFSTHCLFGTLHLSITSKELPTTVPTIYDHFPKPCSRARSNAFTRIWWRWYQFCLIGSWWWWWVKLSLRNTANINGFVWPVCYQAMKISIMACQGRSWHKLKLRSWESCWFFIIRRLLYVQ